jgi:hypothetical protein
METNKLDEILQESKMAKGLKEHSKPSCDIFTFKPLDLIRPSALTFSELCISNDKTHLFIISLIRTVFLVIITKIYYDQIKNSQNYVLETIFSMLSFYVIANIVILFYVMNKKQIYPKKDISE